MTDVVLLLVVTVILALLGALAARGWTADSRDAEWTGSVAAERGTR